MRPAARYRLGPTAALGAGMLGLWVVLALLAPTLPLFDPNVALEPFKKPLDPAPGGATYWLGTDHKGRDILARLLFGARQVLLWSSLAMLAAYAVGVAMGLAAGYLGGWWDEALSFVANVLLSFPVMVLYIVIVAHLGASGLNIVVAVTFASAPAVMRIARGAVIDLRTRDFVAAAKLRGEGAPYMMLSELLPNARGPLIADACLRLGYVIMTLAVLGYLGLGLPPPDPDWGRMIAEAQSMGHFAGHAMVLPALALVSLVLALNLLADGLGAARVPAAPPGR